MFQFFKKIFTTGARRRRFAAPAEPSRKALEQKTREGTDWAVKRYRRTFERLAEFDRT